jgi:archaellum biogenesis protein FlaJ (TadC family)
LEEYSSWKKDNHYEVYLTSISGVHSKDGRILRKAIRNILNGNIGCKICTGFQKM